MKAFEAMFAQRVIAEIASWTFTNVLPYNRWRRLLTPVGKVPAIFLFLPFFSFFWLSFWPFQCKISRKKAWTFTFYLFVRKVNHSNLIFYFDILHEKYPELGLFKCSWQLLKCRICDANFTKTGSQRIIVRKRSF